MKEPFNLAAPPGFVAFDEQRPVHIYQRHLPHWRQEGATYAVTFRLDDALPQSKLQELKRHRARWELANPEPREEIQWKTFAQQVTTMTERWIDRGYGACHLHNAIATLVADALRFYEKTKCRVPCFTVMPNHIHAIMTPLRGFELEKILQTVKGWTARQINLKLDNSSNSPLPNSAACNRQKNDIESRNLWAQESYDRIIRDEEHLFRIVQYIGRNGRTAKLKPNEYLRWISQEWRDAGWGFRDE